MLSRWGCEKRSTDFCLQEIRKCHIVFCPNKMEPQPVKLESRAWSCGTLQAGLDLAGNLNLTMSSLGDEDVQAMEEELAKLQVG